MAPRLPTLSLDEIKQLTKKQDEEVRLCHVFGIFLQEESDQNSHHWTLCDSNCLSGLKIKLIGSIAEYPKPKPGDVVRIHRLGFDRLLRVPMVGHPRNVVVWPAFQYEPTAITTARSPTITSEDNHKRRVLENLYCSMITRIAEIKPNQNPNQKYYIVAGRVEEKSADPYYNSLLTFSDGTGRFVVRVFPKKIDFEVNDHCQVVNELKVGDYFVLSGGKLDSRGQKLDLSANFHMGRSIRIVDKASILGVVLTEQHRECLPSSVDDDEIIDPVGTPEPQEQPETRQGSRPHEHQDQQQSCRSDLNPNQTQTQSPPQLPKSPEPPLPEYTNIANIPKKDDGFYQYYDLAGQIRGKPNETRAYKNWVFQLYDGSKPDYKSFSVDEVQEPVQDCVTILVYSNQKPFDTDKHIEAVKRLKEGDLVFIKNCKASWRSGSLKLEMNPNLGYGKSINVIDRKSPFGIRLKNIVENPLVEELFQTDGLASSDDSFIEP